MKSESTRTQIRKWLENGKKRRASHVIIAYNKRDRDFQPIYVSASQQINGKIQDVNNNFALTPVEVYNLAMDMDKQLGQARCWNA